MSYLKQIIAIYRNPEWIIFVVLVLIYSFFVKKQIVITAIANNVHFNTWDVAVGILSDPFFIIYFIFPIWIIISIKLIKNIWNKNVLIRLSSYQNWMYHSLANALKNIIVLEGLLILITSIVSYDFPIDNGWSDYSSVNLLTNYSSFYLSASNLDPFYAILVQLLFLFIFLFLIHAILTLFYLFIQNTMLTYSFGIFSWVLVIISFKVFMNNKWLNVSNYISLPFSVSSFNSWFYPICIYIILIAFILLLGKFKK